MRQVVVKRVSLPSVFVAVTSTVWRAGAPDVQVFVAVCRCLTAAGSGFPRRRAPLAGCDEEVAHPRFGCVSRVVSAQPRPRRGGEKGTFYFSLVVESAESRPHRVSKVPAREARASVPGGLRAVPQIIQ